jgi:hypothetical protein
VICLLPGTEIAFDREVKAEPNFPLMPKRRIGERVARFRQVALDKPTAHCSSSDNLRLIRHFEKGGSGSSGVRV